MTNVTIAKAINEKPEFVTDVTVADGYADFRIAGTWFWVQITKNGKVRANSLRRA